MELVEQDPDFIALFLQFKASAMDLISVLEQVILELFLLDLKRDIINHRPCSYLLLLNE